MANVRAKDLSDVALDPGDTAKDQNAVLRGKVLLKDDDESLFEALSQTVSNGTAKKVGSTFSGSATDYFGAIADTEGKHRRSKHKKEMDSIQAALSMQAVASNVAMSSGAQAAAVVDSPVVVSVAVDSNRSGPQSDVAMTAEEEELARKILAMQLGSFELGTASTLGSAQSEVVLDPGESETETTFSDLGSAAPQDINEFRGTSQSRSTLDASALNFSDVNQRAELPTGQTKTDNANLNANESKEQINMGIDTKVEVQEVANAASQAYDTTLNKVQSLLDSGEVSNMSVDTKNEVQAILNAASQAYDTTLNKVQSLLDSAQAPVEGTSLTFVGDVNAPIMGPLSPAEINSLKQGALSKIEQGQPVTSEEVTAFFIPGGDTAHVLSEIQQACAIDPALAGVKELLDPQSKPLLQADGTPKLDDNGNAMFETGVSHDALLSIAASLYDAGRADLGHRLAEAISSDLGEGLRNGVFAPDGASVKSYEEVVSEVSAISANDPSLEPVKRFIDYVSERNNHFDEGRLSQAERMNLELMLLDTGHASLALELRVADRFSHDVAAFGVDQALQIAKDTLATGQAQINAQIAALTDTAATSEVFFASVRDSLMTLPDGTVSTDPQDFARAQLRADELQMQIDNTAFDLRHSVGGRDDIVAMVLKDGMVKDAGGDPGAFELLKINQDLELQLGDMSEPQKQAIFEQALETGTASLPKVSDVISKFLGDAQNALGRELKPGELSLVFGYFSDVVTQAGTTVPAAIPQSTVDNEPAPAPAPAPTFSINVPQPGSDESEAEGDSEAETSGTTPNTTVTPGPTLVAATGGSTTNPPGENFKADLDAFWAKAMEDGTVSEAEKFGFLAEQTIKQAGNVFSDIQKLPPQVQNMLAALLGQQLPVPPVGVGPTGPAPTPGPTPAPAPAPTAGPVPAPAPVPAPVPAPPKDYTVTEQVINGEKQLTFNVDNDTKVVVSQENEGSWVLYKKVNDQWFARMGSQGDPHNFVGGTNFDVSRNYEMVSQDFRVIGKTTYDGSNNPTYNDDLTFQIKDDDTGKVIQFTVNNVHDGEMSVQLDQATVDAGGTVNKVWVDEANLKAYRDKDPSNEIELELIKNGGVFNSQGNYSGDVPYDMYDTSATTNFTKNTFYDMLDSQLRSGLKKNDAAVKADKATDGEDEDLAKFEKAQSDMAFARVTGAIQDASAEMQELDAENEEG